MKLMIVESPNKIKKLKSILGGDWTLAASVGHIRDLPDKAMGFEPPYFKPEYVINSDKKKVVANLRSLSKDASEVYLATDPDREGEAIAFHLAETLGLKNPVRIKFNQITKAAIDLALKNKGSIDVHLVAAQEARRVLDRIVGYTISPILSDQSGIPLSAGRVQSPAIKIIVMREREIRKFHMRNYYEPQLVLSNKLLAKLDVKPWCEDGKHIFDKTVAEAIAAETSVEVTSVTHEEKTINPRPPLSTSTLQQVASTVLNISPAKSMELAQSLFEQGVITYHRTDSQNISSEGFEQIKDFLQANGFDSQKTQLIFSTKEFAQEGHEAIRPTHCEEIDCGENGQQKAIYNLIRERALTSVMSPAIDNVSTFEFTTVNEIITGTKISHAKFYSVGRIEKHAGWRSLTKIDKPEAGEGALPASVEKGENYKGKINILEKKTEPPKRFTEASLIKAMEKLGIGRPSTYASILENIKKRKYISIGDTKNKKDKTIKPTELGETLVDSLNDMSFMNLEYTKILEENLDNIATGKNKYLSLVKSVYENITEESTQISISLQLETKPCPLCESPLKKLASKSNKGDFFWVHIEDTTDCDKYLGDDNGSPKIKVKTENSTTQCPSCNQNISRRFSAKREFYFWTHVEQEHEINCVKFINDSDGKPNIKTTN